MHSPPHVIEVRFQRGLYLPEPDLWLDPWDPKPRAFVSHAHADHFARHESVICSETTASLLRSRFRIAENRLQTVSFHVPVIRDGFRIRLLPAGHIPGSAMLHITRTSDNASLLYTGDFKTRRSRTSEVVNFLTADTLILETTFGLPGYEFPNSMEIDAEVLRFVGDAFADGATPVLLAYSLGKAQEALALLEENGIPALLHPAAAAMTRTCIEAGVAGLPEPLEFDGHAPSGHVLIAPPNSVRTNLLKGLKSKRTAMLSGWALQPGAKFRYRVDAMIPFSDHADHPGLMECIQRVRPKRILTVHGFATEFAAELRSRGMDAWSAAGGDQLELPIQRPARSPQPSRGPWHNRVVCSLADFSDLCKLVAETGSRVAKAGFLTSYFSGLDQDEDLHSAVSWLTGESLPKQRGKHPSKLDSPTLRQALVSIPGARVERFREIHLASRDIVRSARLLLQELHLQPGAFDLSGAGDFIRDFREAPASLARVQQLSNRLSSLHPAEGETLIKILTGNLQLGIDQPLIEEALASAFHSSPEEIGRVVKLTGDTGLTAVLAKHKRLDEAAVVERPTTKSETVTHLTGELPFP
jgi:DNA ligase 1